MTITSNDSGHPDGAPVFPQPKSSNPKQTTPAPTALGNQPPKKKTRRWFGKSVLALVGLSLASYEIFKRNPDKVTNDAVSNDTNNTVSSTSNPAATDKQAAEEQIRADTPVDPNSLYTVGFQTLSKQYPWIPETQKSVGFFVGRNNTQRLFGSAVLLDKQGTIALAAHELPEVSAVLRFIKAGTDMVEAQVTNFQYDSANDLMLASIDPAFIEANQLKPIEWGNLGFTGRESGQIVAVGFTSPSLQYLHATVGSILTANNQTSDCRTKAEIPSFETESGSGIFRPDGKFVGVMSAGGQQGLHPQMYFVPSNLIRNAYVDLYPERAAQSGIMATADADEPTTPQPCHISRRNFLTTRFQK